MFIVSIQAIFLNSFLEFFLVATYILLLVTGTDTQAAILDADTLQTSSTSCSASILVPSTITCFLVARLQAPVKAPSQIMLYLIIFNNR